MMKKVPLGYSQPDRKQLVTDSFFGDLDKRGPALSEYFPNLSTLFWTGIKVLGFSDHFFSLEGLPTIITLFRFAPIIITIIVIIIFKIIVPKA